MAGRAADLDALYAVANKHNIPVIEDAAQSFGAEYKSEKSCNLSTIGCTSAARRPSIKTRRHLRTGKSTA